tara:strand:+ start:5990 stop:7552 length:1563 start_codon:yes stop_codon:yes gene_type:complete
MIKRLWDGEERPLEEEQSAGDSRIGLLAREFASHPSKGLTPEKLHRILEEAEQGDLQAQSDLFEDMEEKDPQIGSDLAKRRQMAAELEWQVSPPENASAAEKKASEFCSEVLSSIEVEDLVLDMGAGLGHGFAMLEVPWRRDGANRLIEQPTLRPHSWFRLHPDEQDRLMIRDMSATGADPWALGWVQHRHRARPGYIARSGLHRMLAWPYLFQNYALGDLAQLLEIYGLPARVGKYPRNATDKEKAALLRAVVSLGSSAAGIIPDGMAVDFMEAADGRADMFETMITWCERAKAKVILGGTLTSGTGEGTNTNALGNVHERSLGSLISSDVRQYAGTIKRDLLWPMAALNFGVEDIQRAPKFWLDTGEVEDYKALAESLPTFVDMGMKIPQWWAHEKSGIPKADEKDEVLVSINKAADQSSSQFGALKQKLNTNVAALRGRADLDATGKQIDSLTNDDPTAAWSDAIRELAETAESLEELRDRLVELLPDLGTEGFANVMADALAAAHLAGRYDIMEGL